MTDRTITSDMSTDEVAEEVCKALTEAMPGHSVRVVSDDEVAIEDDGGEDWILTIRDPRG